MPPSISRLSKSFLVLNGHRIFEINKPIFRIGSAADNDIVLTDPGVTSARAEIVFSEGMFILLDRNSGDPPRINGESISVRQLSPGDMIQFGSDSLLFGWNRSATTPDEQQP